MFRKLLFAIALLLLPSAVFAGGLNIPENVKVAQISCLDEPGGITDIANVLVTWDSQEFATSYVVYSRVENQPNSVGQEVISNSNTLALDSSKNFYLSVSAVNEFRGTNPTYSRSESDKSREVFVDLKQTCEIASQLPKPSDYDYRIQVVEQQYLGGNKRGVVLSWNYASPGDKNNVFKDSYRVYVREAGKTGYGAPVASTTSNSMWIGLNTDLDYYIRLEACGNDVGCVLNYSEPYLGKYAYPTISVTTPVSTPSGSSMTVTSSGTSTSSVSNPVDNSKVEELNKKVIELQKGLEESQKKQAETESTLNKLIAWLKSIFPFFN